MVKLKNLGIKNCKFCSRGGRITYSRYAPRGYKVICSGVICLSRKNDKERPKFPTKEAAVEDWNKGQS